MLYLSSGRIEVSGELDIAFLNIGALGKQIKKIRLAK